MRTKYRIVTLFISMVLILSQLTGCSQEDLGYLSLLKEMSASKKGSMDYNISFTPNKQTIYNSMKENFSSEDLKYVNEIINFNKINLSLTGDFDMSDISKMKFDIDIKYSFDDKDQEDFGSIKFIDNKILISNKAFMNIYKLTPIIYKAEEISSTLEKISSDNSIFSDKDYFLVADFNEDLNKILEELSQYQDEINEDFIDYSLISEMFEDFDSGLITKANSGYKFEFDGKKIADTLKKATMYLIENEMSGYYADDFSYAEYYAATFSCIYSIIEPFRNSQFKGSIYKVGNTYTEEISSNLNYMGLHIGDMYCKSKIELKDVSIGSENISNIINIYDAIDIISSIMYFNEDKISKEDKINIENTEIPMVRTSEGFSSYDQDLLPVSTYNYKNWSKETKDYKGELCKDFNLYPIDDYFIEESYSYKDAIEINGKSVLEQDITYSLTSDGKKAFIIIAQLPSVKDAQNLFAADLYSRQGSVLPKLSGIGDIAYGNSDFIGFTRANMYVIISNETDNSSIANNSVDVKDMAKNLDTQILNSIK